MCGRFTLTHDINEVAARFNSPPPDFAYGPRYNIAPSQAVPVVIKDQEKNNRLKLMRWGLIPFWAREKSIGNRLINARMETITEKPSFKKAARQQRCIIPADGYYEWLKWDGRKQPMCIRPKNKEIIALGGIFDSWKDEDGKIIYSCAIVTTDAAAAVKSIHHRMPLIIPAPQEEEWLSSYNNTPEKLNRLMASFNPPELEAYPVSTEVNSPRHDYQELIMPL